MKVFISWSGERSRAIAEALRYWLPKVIQNLEVWLSAADIDKGTRWRSEIANNLEQSDIGIICLTPENLTKPWILFEAGVLSKKQQSSYVCTFLYELNPADVEEPLAQFQSTKATEEDIKSLVKTINSVLPQSRLSETDINEIFDVWWPKLEERLTSIMKPSDESEHKRGDREILEEVLELVRAQSRISQSTLSSSLSGSKPRLLSTLNWSPEDAQIITEHYQRLKDSPIMGDEDIAHLNQLRIDEDYAKEILAFIKAGRKARQNRQSKRASIKELNKEKEQSNENADS